MLPLGLAQNCDLFVVVAEQCVKSAPQRVTILCILAFFFTLDLCPVLPSNEDVGTGTLPVMFTAKS